MLEAVSGQAHNLEVGGSIPPTATKYKYLMFTSITDLPLPQVPQSIIDRLKLVMDSQTPIFTINNSSSFEIRTIPEDIISWTRDNITKDAEKVFLQTIDNGSSFVPHIDPITPSGQIRYYNLLYLIDTGGENVETCFYETTSEDLIKCRATHVYKFPYSDVKLISKKAFKKNTWNLMNNQCIHSVEGITRTRMKLSLSFYSKDFPEFLKQYLL